MLVIIMVIFIAGCPFQNLMPNKGVPDVVIQDPLARMGNIEMIVDQLRTKFGKPKISIVFADKEYSLMTYEWNVGEKTYVVIKRNGEYSFIYTRDNAKSEPDADPQTTGDCWECR